MSETKTVKAWAVVSVRSKIQSQGGTSVAYKSQGWAEWFCDPRKGERVVPVTITYEVTR